MYKNCVKELILIFIKLFIRVIFIKPVSFFQQLLFLFWHNEKTSSVSLNTDEENRGKKGLQDSSCISKNYYITIFRQCKHIYSIIQKILIFVE